MAEDHLTAKERDWFARRSQNPTRGYQPIDDEPEPDQPPSGRASASLPEPTVESAADK
jgi:hypothetical protein